VVLYSYATCPFCNKVRAFLDLARVPYIVVEVNPLTKSELAWSSYKKVPLAVVNGTPIGDSNAIIDAVAALGGGAGSSSSSCSSGSAREAETRSWVDSKLLPLLTVNIYRSLGESLDTFDYLQQRNFPTFMAAAIKYTGAPAMWLVARRRKAALALPEGVDERAALSRALSDFIASHSGAPFHGGAAPDTADVCAFGVLRAIEGLAAHTEAMASSTAEPWYRRMALAVGSSSMLHRVGEAPAALK